MFLLALLSCTPTSAPPERDATVDTSELGDVADVAAADTDTDAVAAVDTDTADTDEPEDIPSPWAFDAGFIHPNGKLYIFHGPTYTRYDLPRDEADAGYPLATATFWQGLGDAPIDAAYQDGAGTLWVIRGDRLQPYDIAADRVVAPDIPLADRFPTVTPPITAAERLGDTLWLIAGPTVHRLDPDTGLDLHPPTPTADLFAGWSRIDALFATTNFLYAFRDLHYTRLDRATLAIPSVYPRDRRFWWPGLPDPIEGTGQPGYRLPPVVATHLAQRPSDAEIAQRRARVAASVGDFTDRTADYPLFVASIEERFSTWGCGLLQRGTTWRWRCASGPLIRLEIDPWTLDGIDWRAAAHHRIQVSQGDFFADIGTPVSLFGCDDDTYELVALTPTPATGSIVAGVRARVACTTAGTRRELTFSHLSPHVPGFALDAIGGTLPTGVPFGFIGLTGNLWIAAPPATDAPTTGAGLPDPHTHIWFVSDPANHETLTPTARETIDASTRYPYGGG